MFPSDLTDTPVEDWNAPSNATHVPAVVAQVKEMRRRGHGVIGMKLIGNGDFQKPEQREQSIRYVLQSDLCDAVVIGFKSTAEIDEAIERVNRALVEAQVVVKRVLLLPTTTWSTPHRVVPEKALLPVKKGVVTLPPHSLTILRVALK